MKLISSLLAALLLVNEAHGAADPGDRLSASLQGLCHELTIPGLARVTLATDKSLALKYVEQGLATGVTGGTREDLVRLRKDLE